MKQVAATRPLPQLRSRFVIVLPTELAAQIRDLAAKERRQLNTQIQMLIERALASESLAA